jgi:hypothetical protein
MNSYWKGASSGFLFGTLGLWLFALLALITSFFELVGEVFFAPGRLLVTQLFGSSATTPQVLFLFLVNGILYALIGVGVQYLWRKR